LAFRCGSTPEVIENGAGSTGSALRAVRPSQPFTSR
jgi:hypothetical protein